MCWGGKKGACVCCRVSNLRSRGICVPQTLVLHMPMPPPMTMHLPPHLRLLEPMPLFLLPAPCPLPPAPAGAQRADVGN